MVATLALLVVMHSVGAGQYRSFSNGQVILNVFIDNGFLLVVAVGMTFVILAGGIDLSVGSVVALTTMIAASMLQDGAWPPHVVLPVVLAVGSLFGFAMGCVIHYFDIQPFIVTLAGLFLARGLCTTISTVSISITDPLWTALAQEPESGAIPMRSAATNSRRCSWACRSERRR